MPAGPAGTYTYSVSVTIPMGYTYLGNNYVWPAAAITAAEANQSLPLGATPSLTIPSANSNCYEVFSVDASIAWPAPVGTDTLDPRRVVTVTQTGAPAGTVLDSILFTTDEDPPENMKLVFPTTTVQAVRKPLPRLGRVVLEFHPADSSGWRSPHDRLLAELELVLEG